MAAIVATVFGGVATFAQLVVTADLTGMYDRGNGFPSAQVRNVLIFALVTAVWGVLVALFLPFASARYANFGMIDSATPNVLFFTFIVDVISAALLTRSSVNGGACIDKASVTCHLYTAALALEWVMAGFALVGMMLSSYINQRSGLRTGLGYV